MSIFCMRIVDQSQRESAVDITRSFIVQAPAGSGKTEILTQRFLRLLSRVEAPEQIVALTFTRKAANEMRERIVLALQKAATDVTPASEHQRNTFDYARAALARAEILGWQLLESPNRLKVFTIDALCQSLTQAIPISDQHVPYATLTDTPQRLYHRAANDCLDYLLASPEHQLALQQLLFHLDNRQDKLLSLFESLLANRIQWLEVLMTARVQDKSTFERALAVIEQHQLTQFRNTLPPPLAQELVFLAQSVVQIEDNPDSPRAILSSWTEFKAADRQICKGLAALLLTGQQQFRKAFDHHVGLRRGSCANEHYDHLKSRSQALLTALSDYPDFLESLLHVKSLPEPQYAPEQWEVLQALFTILPLLAAHLQVIFKQHNAVDFSAVSTAALQALGDSEHPTDLALYLDHQIHHLLVDEFQDTSIQQFQLLSQLLQGWQPDDGRTLFVVGDPMQSIYRFRAAEVGLFLRAKQQGIGGVPLTPLTLSCNFRSAESIVSWVNQQFSGIFPTQEDIESGAVCFHASQQTKPNQDSVIHAEQCTDKSQEAQQLLCIVEKELSAYPEDDIAILVRSRSHLSQIIPLLRAKQIPFQGVEIDYLSVLPHLRDVWSITEALLFPANRRAWLSVLRSPWCGLDLADLHAIAQFDKTRAIYHALQCIDQIPNLSEEGQLRAQWVYQILNQALIQRHQQPLIDWILHTLTQLKLDHILSRQEQADLEQFWQLLEKFEHNGLISDRTLFKAQLNALYSKNTTPARLQIMTIHKSKGLEFDCVILPGLSARPAPPDQPLLRWLQLPTEHDALLLVSPIKAAHEDHCLVYDYLGKLDQQKSRYELQRLLYVAVTRAKSRLYLLDHHDTGSELTFRHLLKNQNFLQSTDVAEAIEESVRLPKLSRLPSAAYNIQPPPLVFTNPPLTWPTDSSARLLGIAAHELLQWIATYHPPMLQDVPWTHFLNTLRTSGFESTAITDAQQQLQTQLMPLFDSPIGRWIMHAHSEEHNEYALLVESQGELTTRILDRFFLDQGKRWIIDFKTGEDHETNETTHRTQVNAYGRLIAQCHPEPIHCGLYYLATGRWVSWAWDPHLK